MSQTYKQVADLAHQDIRVERWWKNFWCGVALSAAVGFGALWVVWCNDTYRIQTLEEQRDAAVKILRDAASDQFRRKIRKKVEQGPPPFCTNPSQAWAPRLS